MRAAVWSRCRPTTGRVIWWAPFKAADVDTLTALVAGGKVKPAIDRRFTVDEIVEAHRYVDEGRSAGKVVITV
jgi:NADPH:quinone reductase-like Zn-dependent oxidoreductase